MAFSTITHLQCSGCGREYPHKKLQTFCAECNSPLMPAYDLRRASEQLKREDVSRRPRGMWRWHELLPVVSEEHIVSLGEGDAPLLRVPNLERELGFSTIYAKDESSNPTASFKARGLAAAISKAKELGVKKVIIPTAGNAGGAMAAYAARAGMRASIFMPTDSPAANIQESRIAGAEVELVDGLISDAARLAGEKARKEGWFDLSTFKEPYRVEGKKVMGYELAEAFGWRLPDVILYPTGGGTGLVGMWKGFAELEQLGWLEDVKRPRMVSVQAQGCAPVVKAFEAGADRCEFWENAQTVASGLRVPKSFADEVILQDIHASEGTAVAVSDEAILTAQRQLAGLEGILAAPEGAATVAALQELVRRGWLHSGEQVVLFNTGSGLKYLDAR